MNKPMLGLAAGGTLGALDGLSALVSAPETQPMIVGIVIGSTIKGIVAGLLIGWFAGKVQSMTWGIVVGLLVGLVLAFIVAAMPDEQGNHYWWQIMLPGSIVGLIVGYATQRYGTAPRR